MECGSPLFFFYEKKIYKNKKYLPTMSVKESAMIPLVKNQIIAYINTTKIYRTIQKTTTLLQKPLRQGNTIQWILLWKGSSLVHLPFRGGILLLSYRSKYNTSFHVSLHCLNSFIQCYHHLRTFQRRNILEVEPSKKSSYIYYI